MYSNSSNGLAGLKVNKLEYYRTVLDLKVLRDYL